MSKRHGKEAVVDIRRAGLNDLGRVAVLFDLYRQFYGRTGNIRGACDFIGQRLEAGDSVIFLAIADDGDAAGFVQLYPGFSSVSMARTYILNDLFVVPAFRRQQVASGLLAQATAFAQASGAVRLSLSTAVDNVRAQALYERCGWKKDELFLHYTFSL